MTTNTTHTGAAPGVAGMRILALDVTLSDMVDEDGLLCAVTSVRLQGANPAEVLLELAGKAGRRRYPTTAVLTAHRQAA